MAKLIGDGMLEIKDDRRGPAPRNDAYARFHSRCGVGSHDAEDFDLAVEAVG